MGVEFAIHDAQQSSQGGLAVVISSFASRLGMPGTGLIIRRRVCPQLRQHVRYDMTTPPTHQNKVSDGYSGRGSSLGLWLRKSQSARDVLFLTWKEVPAIHTCLSCSVRSHHSRLTPSCLSLSRSHFEAENSISNISTPGKTRPTPEDSRSRTKVGFTVYCRKDPLSPPQRKNLYD